MTIAERLNSIQQNQEQLLALNNMDGKKFTRSSFFPDTLFISLTAERGEQEVKDILDWFLDGGHVKTYSEVSTPYGERKNSKKKNTTKFFTVKKGCMYSQIGHLTTQNYTDDFFSMVIKKMLDAPAGKFCYDNGSFISYVMERNPKVIDLGEKK